MLDVGCWTAALFEVGCKKDVQRDKVQGTKGQGTKGQGTKVGGWTAALLDVGSWRGCGCRIGGEERLNVRSC